MGFLDKLKSAVSSITGGGAKVFVTAENPSRTTPFTVKVKAVVADHELKISRAYVRLIGLEEVYIPNVRVENSTQNIRENTNTFERDFNIALEQTLNPNQEYEWEAQVEFPADAQPTFRGRYATHTLRILAGLDTPGNDPDSGWIVLDV